MNWQQLISNKRFGLEEIHEARKDDRSEFQRDFDRLIFSAPFRRLQNKTQVFPLPGSVFVHNRLTHSLEVSCVGRSLGDSIANRLIAKHPELAETHVSEIGAIVSAALSLSGPSLCRSAHQRQLCQREEQLCIWCSLPCRS